LAKADVTRGRAIVEKKLGFWDNRKATRPIGILVKQCGHWASARHTRRRKRGEWDRVLKNTNAKEVCVPVFFKGSVF